MTSWKWSLRGRIVLVSGLALLLGTLVVILVVGDFWNSPALARVGTGLGWARTTGLQACEADAGAKLAVPLAGEAWAVDLATGTSTRADAPHVPTWMLSTTRDNGTALRFMPGFRREVGAMQLVETGGRGACSGLLIAWRADERLRMGFRVTTFSSLVLLGALALVVTSIGVVRPLERRLEQLQRAARRVGSEQGPRVQGEDELAHVERILSEVHDRLVEDRARDERARRALEALLADVAHDLRTPLAALSLALEEALRHLPDDHPSASAIGDALGDATHLSELTDNLRVARQLEAEEAPSGAPLDLGEVVERVGRRVGRLARARGIALEVAVPDAPVEVIAHAVLAEQAIANVVHNAVRYNRRGGHVALWLTVADEAFVVRVDDDGPGIPDDQIPRLLERGQTLSGQSSGLGLAITRAACDRLGWTLHLEPADPGLTVRFAGRARAAPSPTPRPG